MSGWTVYILHSITLNRHYIGCTENLPSRIEKHLHKFYGTDSYTAKTTDWSLLFALSCKSESQAKSIEKHIKRMKSKVYINNLIRYSEMQQKLLEMYDC